MVVALLAALAPSVSALECDGIPVDDGCLFTVTGGDTADPNDGFFVTNADGVPMWDFVKDRDLNALGYPISQRWISGPFTLQAFQKVILQWDPAKGRMNYYNTLDALANRYPHIELPFVPAHQVLAEDQGATFGTIIRNHLALLEANAAIKDRFLAEPDWFNLYGLPIRYEEREVDGNPQGVQMLRAQRTVFVVWNVPTPGTTVGRVNLQNVPDKVKQLSNVIIPDHVKSPMGQLDPAMAAAIRSLFWPEIAADPSARAVADRLETIARSSPDLFWYLINDSDTDYWRLRSRATLTDVRLFDLLIEIGNLPWVQDGVSNFDRVVLKRVIHNAPTHRSPPYTEALIRKNWFKDGISENELLFINWMSPNIGAIRSSDQRSPEDAQNMSLKLLSMPFLDAIDGVEIEAIDQLREKYRDPWVRDPRPLRNAIRFMESKGGLTDDQSILIVFSNLLEITDTHDPKQLGIFLDPNYDGWTSSLGIIIEKRRISLPYTGSILVAVARRGHVSLLPMDVVEHAIRIIEHAMREPYPHNNIHVFIKDNISQTFWDMSYIWMRPSRFGQKEPFTVPPNSLIFELTSKYWTFHPIIRHRWITGGAGVFLAIQSQHKGMGYLRDLDRRCEFEKIRDIVDSKILFGTCPFALGAGLLFDLYNSLGDEVFYDRLWQLNRLVKEIRSTQEARVWPIREAGVIGLQYLRHAFLTDVDPGTAETIDRILNRWYYGPA